MFPLRDTQPSYSKPVVTVLLIVINILVFLFQVSLDPYSRNEFIAAYGLGGAAAALSAASVVNAIGTALRLALRFHSRIETRVLVRGGASVAAIIGAGALSRWSAELSPSGFALRVAYLAAASLVLWMTTSEAERAWLRSWRIASAP